MATTNELHAQLNSMQKQPTITPEPNSTGLVQRNILKSILTSDETALTIHRSKGDNPMIVLPYTITLS